MSYTKRVAPASPFVPSKPLGPTLLPPAPPSAAVDVSVIFSRNASFPYNKGAMLQVLPGGRLAAASQAGMNPSVVSK
eukprot:SAG11_NODE_1047_length_6040_cov_3.805588_2_plen_77_part_00